MSEQRSVPDHMWLADVSAESLSALMRDKDPDLARRIQELVALLRTPREATLAGWNSYVDPGSNSG